jgi:hypothetical protein
MNNTMVLNDLIDRFYGSRASLEQVYNLSKKVQGLQGDLVELGIAMGSGIAAMKMACPEKTVWGYDSFQGIHLAGPNDTEQPGIGKITHDVNGELLVSSGVTVHTREQVETILFEYLKFKEEDFILVEGWVQDTLPKMKPKKIALLRLDMDLHDPTLFALEKLWDRLVKGGVLIIDDGNLSGVVKACDTFFKSIGYTPGWIQKKGENPFYLVK